MKLRTTTIARMTTTQQALLGLAFGSVIASPIVLAFYLLSQAIVSLV